MNRRMRKSITILLVLVMVLVTGCSNAQNGSKATDGKVVKIGYLPLTHALPAFEEKELIDASKDSDFTIELVKFGSWPELLDALNTGAIDGASALVELAIKSIDEGNKLKLVALGHRDGNAITVAKDINSVEDLKGKKFAIPHRMSSQNILLKEMVENSKISIEDISIIEMSPAEMPSALASGQISGYCVAEPFGAAAVSSGIGKILYQSSDLWEDSICCGLVLTEKFINDNAEIAKEYANKYIEAGNNLTKEKALEVAQKYLSQKKDVLELSLDWISYDDLSITKEGYNDLISKMKQYGILDTNLKYEDVIFNTSK
ncbi:ABC transporter substrate-binding protein [Anaeromicropila herbilytica]|uniref:NLPA lipoprotein n=1 Tax=Anaeromicropila herbilytica TaxID=2785025 RepID=A0A7R7EMT7_9FIRM|nr:ABC transporter substrate-binding protein [Anaeromicropila herbilytica]BCN31649.1 NLPA lipoprotein [Anaeromicropila herbilytica]